MLLLWRCGKTHTRHGFHHNDDRWHVKLTPIDCSPIPDAAWLEDAWRLHQIITFTSCKLTVRLENLPPFWWYLYTRKDGDLKMGELLVSGRVTTWKLELFHITSIQVLCFWITWLWCYSIEVTFPKTNTSPLKMMVSKRNLLFLGSIFMGSISFREGRVLTSQGCMFLSLFWGVKIQP